MPRGVLGQKRRQSSEVTSADGQTDRPGKGRTRWNHTTRLHQKDPGIPASQRTHCEKSRAAEATVVNKIHVCVRRLEDSP